MNKTAYSELNVFIEEWKETSEKNREVFVHLKEYLASKEGVTLEFIPRPCVTVTERPDWLRIARMTLENTQLCGRERE